MHVETGESVGIGTTWRVVIEGAAVFVGATLAVMAEDREAACAGSVGPKPKQAVCKDAVIDYKSLVLLYEICVF